MTSRRGFTLLELLVALAMMGLITAGATSAFLAGVRVEQRLRDGMRREERIASFERELESMVGQAYLSTDTTNAASFFIGNSAEGQTTGIQQGQGTQGQNADELTFTAVGIRPPSYAVESTDDFETSNQRYGPQGGIGEYCLSLQGYDAPSDLQGLFLREEHPADGDPTQGGVQRVMNPDVAELQLEFFDGEAWQPQWDTRTQSTARLPAAVRIHYRLRDENDFRVLTVRVQHSDVTPTNPVTTAGGTQ
jgi:prepilin-type N-terminal cleavage/methylation domain-containing protein